MPKKKKEKKKKKKKAKIRANRISMRASDLAWQKLIDDDSGEPYYFNSVTQVIHACFFLSLLDFILSNYMNDRRKQLGMSRLDSKAMAVWQILATPLKMMTMRLLPRLQSNPMKKRRMSSRGK